MCAIQDPEDYCYWLQLPFSTIGVNGRLEWRVITNKSLGTRYNTLSILSPFAIGNDVIVQFSLNCQFVVLDIYRIPSTSGLCCSNNKLIDNIYSLVALTWSMECSKNEMRK